MLVPVLFVYLSKPQGTFKVTLCGKNLVVNKKNNRLFLSQDYQFDSCFAASWKFDDVKTGI